MSAARPAVVARATEPSPLWDFEWQWLPGRDAAARDDLVEACLALYAGHYGMWGPLGHSPGEPVRTNRARFLQLVNADDAWLACALRDTQLIGYCVAVKTDLPGRGRIAWVSQLVVDRNYRRARVATRLLLSVWQFSDCYAWGLATANPFAIRALETATRRPCRAGQIKRRAPEILEHLRTSVPYLPVALISENGKTSPRVATEFFLSHADLPKMQRQAARADRRWALGNLGEGEEWLGCTFADQPAHALGDNDLADLLTGTDGIWIQAYEGMALDEHHAWHQHAVAEVDAVLTLTRAPASVAVLDVGCGDGRHAAAFAARGYAVTGIDIAHRLLDRARVQVSGDVSFAVSDARRHVPPGPFGLAICLYDVLGSSAGSNDDVAIVRNIARALCAGGHLVASVMNTSVTAGPTQRPQTNAEFIEALERLPLSATMESTGSVFDPDLLVVYKGIHYRKEQFQKAGWRLPSELVVRDRRFTSADVATLIASAGLELVKIEPVQAGEWRRAPPLDEADPRAKELLVVARRPL